MTDDEEFERMLAEIVELTGETPQVALLTSVMEYAYIIGEMELAEACRLELEELGA